MKRVRGKGNTWRGKIWRKWVGGKGGVWKGEEPVGLRVHVVFGVQ
jgi:hypothetical protein